jgi:hypothetical protein
MGKGGSLGLPEFPRSSGTEYRGMRLKIDSFIWRLPRVFSCGWGKLRRLVGLRQLPRPSRAPYAEGA